MFPVTGARVDLFLCSQVFQFYVEMLSFGFCLVNSECDAYIPVDHSSVYSHSKMCVFFSGLKSYFSAYIFSFIAFCSWI